MWQWLLIDWIFNSKLLALEIYTTENILNMTSPEVQHHLWTWMRMLTLIALRVIKNKAEVTHNDRSHRTLTYKTTKMAGNKQNQFKDKKFITEEDRNLSIKNNVTCTWAERLSLQCFGIEWRWIIHAWLLWDDWTDCQSWIMEEKIHFNNCWSHIARWYYCLNDVHSSIKLIEDFDDFKLTNGMAVLKCKYSH